MENKKSPKGAASCAAKRKPYFLRFPHWARVKKAQTRRLFRPAHAFPFQWLGALGSWRAFSFARRARLAQWGLVFSIPRVAKARDISPDRLHNGRASGA